MDDLFKDLIPSKKQRDKLIATIQRGVHPAENSVLIRIRGTPQLRRRLIGSILQYTSLISKSQLRHWSISAHVPLVLDSLSQYSKAGFLIMTGTAYKHKKERLVGYTVLKIDCSVDVDDLSNALSKNLSIQV